MQLVEPSEHPNLEPRAKESIVRFRFPIRGVIVTVAGMMVWAATAASAQDSTDTDRSDRREGRRFRFGDPDRLEWRFRPRVRVRVDGLRDFDAFGRADHPRGRGLRESARLRGDFARELARWQRDFSRPRMRWYRDQSDWRDEIRRQILVDPDVRVHPEIHVRPRIRVRPDIDLPEIEIPEIRVRPDPHVRPQIRVRPMRIHRGRYHSI
jgi:hypothetical protein